MTSKVVSSRKLLGKVVKERRTALIRIRTVLLLIWRAYQPPELTFTSAGQSGVDAVEPEPDGDLANWDKHFDDSNH